MKFSDTISNPSIAGHFSVMWRKCWVRRPTPRSGRPYRLGTRARDESMAGRLMKKSGAQNRCQPGRSARMAAWLPAWASALRVRRIDGDLAAALALAGVLAGAAAVTTLASAL